jgi:hypothetical protein
MAQFLLAAGWGNEHPAAVKGIESAILMQCVAINRDPVAG